MEVAGAAVYDEMVVGAILLDAAAAAPPVVIPADETVAAKDSVDRMATVTENAPINATPATSVLPAVE